MAEPVRNTHPPPRILIVEDEKIVAADLAATLGELGYSVVAIAGRGEDALDLAKAHAPDLVLMDVRLAGSTDGFETAAAIKQEMDVAIVYLTAHSDAETLRRAMAHDAFGFVVKPFHRAELKAAVEIARFRHAAEARIQESEERFRTLTELSADWYWEQDENLRYVDFHRHVESAAGSSVASHLGKTRWELPTLGVTDAQWAEHRATLEARQPFRAFEYRRLNERGEEIWVSSSGAPIFDAKGRFRGYRGTASNITARKRAEAALGEAKELLQRALDASDLCLWDTNLSTGEVFLSEGWAALLGHPREPTRTTVAELTRLIHPDEVAEVQRAQGETMRGERAAYLLEHRVLTARGDWKWILSSGRVTERDGAGRAMRMSGTNRDVTERKTAQLALVESEERFRSLTALSSDWYWEQDASFRFKSISRQLADLEIEPNEYLGKLRWDVPTLNMTPEDWARHAGQLARHETFHDLEICRLDLGGHERWFSISGEPVFDADGRFLGYRGVGRDITALKEAQLRLLHLAHYDALTGVANRRLFEDRLQQALARSHRRKALTAVACLDLDRFKGINDTLGHAAGDAVLKEFAVRLLRCVRATDTVARLGGDEFALLLEDLTSRDSALRVVEKVRSAMRAPIEHAGSSLVVETSAGIAFAEVGSRQADALLVQADAALYAAKGKGGGGHVVARDGRSGAAVPGDEFQETNREDS